MEYRDFYKQVLGVTSAVQESFADRPLTSDVDVPEDWPALRDIVRGVAEDLMLCADTASAIAKLRDNPTAALGVVWLTNHISDNDVIEAMKLAYKGIESDAPFLPGRAFASYLIELCDGLELQKRSHDT
jgi:hypothetical protein